MHRPPNGISWTDCRKRTIPTPEGSSVCGGKSLCFGFRFPRIGQCSKMLVLALPFLPLPNIPKRLHLTLTPEGQIFIFDSFKAKIIIIIIIVINKHRARKNFKESLLSYKPAFPVITEWEMGGVYFGRIVICACLPFKLNNIIVFKITKWHFNIYTLTRSSCY